MVVINVRIWLCVLIILSSGVESFVTPIQQMTTRKHHRPSYSIDKSSYTTICSNNNIILSRVSKLSKRYRCRSKGIISMQSSNECNGDTTSAKTSTRTWRQYYSMMRPITILQAVGAFLVGRLVILSSPSSSYNQNTIITTILASISIYLGYGAGMAMNDIADVNIDSQHDTKQNRSIASNNISVKQGWMFCFVISMLSVAFACLANLINNNGHNMATTTGLNFAGWNILNILLMLSYAFRMQRIFLVKNKYVDSWQYLL